MDIYEIDVTGNDLLSENYGIIVLYNNKHCYAYKINSELQKVIRGNFNQKLYGFKNKRILKPRVYCAILSLILLRISQKHIIEKRNFFLNICNDFDGHQNNIIEILKRNNKKLLIFESISPGSYCFTKHPKKSKIQQLAIKLHRKEWVGINKVKLDINSIHNLISKAKYNKNKW